MKPWPLVDWCYPTVYKCIWSLFTQVKGRYSYATDLNTTSTNNYGHLYQSTITVWSKKEELMDIIWQSSQPACSNPGLPTSPHPSQDVGVSGMVHEALHLLLNRVALLSDTCPLVVSLVSHQNGLQGWIFLCLLVACLQVSSVKRVEL